MMANFNRVRLLLALFLFSNIALAAPQSQLAQSSQPAFTEYRGVRMGMTATEVREKLGKPKVKDKAQDLFVFDENESAQIFYDAQEKVYAISIDFAGQNNGAPSVRQVLNEDVAPRADGSLYLMKRYSDAGYWISYNRTSSNPPQITITMQKLPS